MATCPVKWLKDEDGNKFMPITHIDAVLGEEYTTAVLTAKKQSAGHYLIENDNLEYASINNCLLAVRFDEIGETTNPAYIKLNNEQEYPIYKADGINTLPLTGLENSVCLFTYIDKKWQLTIVGVDESASGGGHVIVDEDNNILPQRSVLNFRGFDIKDSAGDGATVIKNPSWCLGGYEGINGEITADTWTRLYDEGLYAPEAGVYKVSTYLKLNNISQVGREVCVRVGETEEWYYQFKRLSHTFTTLLTVEDGQNLTPSIFVDKISSADDIIITECKIYIEHINV